MSAPTKWRAWTAEDDAQPRNIRRAPHAWHTIKGFRFPWPVCAHCGLVWLKNEASRKAAKQLCEWEPAA